MKATKLCKKVINCLCEFFDSSTAVVCARVDDLNDKVYLDLNFDAEEIGEDELRFINEVHSLAGKVLGKRVIVVSRCNPQYHGDTD